MVVCDRSYGNRLTINSLPKNQTSLNPPVSRNSCPCLQLGPHSAKFRNLQLRKAQLTETSGGHICSNNNVGTSRTEVIQNFRSLRLGLIAMQTFASNAEIVDVFGDHVGSLLLRHKNENFSRIVCLVDLSQQQLQSVILIDVC